MAAIQLIAAEYEGKRNRREGKSLVVVLKEKFQNRRDVEAEG